jgi:hypothetical protein
MSQILLTLFHVLFWTMKGPPIVYEILTNVAVLSYDWA